MREEKTHLPGGTPATGELCASFLLSICTKVTRTVVDVIPFALDFVVTSQMEPTNQKRQIDCIIFLKTYIHTW